MFQFEEILIAILIGAISVLAWTYVQKKSNGARKSSGQKTRRPKILANVLEEIESRCNYNERIKRAASSSPPNVSEAESILSEMTKNNVAPSTLTYNNLIGAYSKSTSSFEWVDSVMSSITEDGLSPDLVTYNCLLHAYASAKPSRVADAEKLMDHIEKEMNPDNVTYTTLIAAYATAQTAETQKIH